MIKEILPFFKNRILVVDDEEFCLTSTRTILEKLGIDVARQVDFCISGEEAV
jgi:CheY-like chemotaxis protein